MNLNELMSVILDDKKWSQSKMAKKMGWEYPQYVSSIVRGQRMFPKRDLKRFSKISGIAFNRVVDLYLEEERQRILKMNGVQDV
jgi:transcriptional regulator with XRE-family HTH domain